MTRQALLKNARAAANARGHKLSKFAKGYGGHYWRAFCYTCGRCAFVTPKSCRNEIKISGEAIALECKPLYMTEEK
jgi:hypothetical protein